MTDSIQRYTALLDVTVLQPAVAGSRPRMCGYIPFLPLVLSLKKIWKAPIW